MFYSNLNMLSINGEPILEPITDKDDVALFVNKIKDISFMTQEAKDNIISEITAGNITLAFYKDATGFDDRVILLDAGTFTVYTPTHEVTKIGLAYAGDKDKKNDGKGGNNSESTDGHTEGGGWNADTEDDTSEGWDF